jgi:hypothetical protein
MAAHTPFMNFGMYFIALAPLLAALYVIYFLPRSRNIPKGPNDPIKQA